MTFRNQILHGDALESLIALPDDSIDITVTSPPYNKQKNTFGWLVQTNRYDNYDDKRPENDYQSWQITVLDELFRVTKPGGSLFYNHKIRWVDGQLFHPVNWVSKTNWTFRQEIIWDRSIAANLRGWRFYQIDERIYWLYKPINQHLIGKELESRHAKMSSIWRFKPVKRRADHPAPFPLELAVRAIYSMQEPSENVLIADPFCGTGTTLVAAKLLGYDYFGIDISEEYVKLALGRLKNSEQEREKAEAETAKHIVKDPYKNRKKRGTVNWPFAPEPKTINETPEVSSNLIEPDRNSPDDANTTHEGKNQP